MSAAEDMRLVWLREDLEKERVEVAKLQAQLTRAHEEIGSLRWKLEQAEKRCAAST